MIIAELRWVTLLKYVYFLQHYVGLGLFYIFVGGLILGDSWWMILVAIVLLAVGIVYLLLGCACRRMVTKPIIPRQNGATGGAPLESDDARWEQSVSRGGGAYANDGGAASGGGPAYGGFTPAYAGGGAAAAGGGAGGWGLNVGGVNVTPTHAFAAMNAAQSMGLTADHVVQGAQFAQKHQGAYGS